MEVSSKEIASFLNKTLVGENVTITGISAIESIRHNTLVFAKRFNESMLNLLNQPNSPFLAIVTADYAGKLKYSYIISENPRLDFIKVVNHYLLQERVAYIHSTAIIESGAKIGSNVSIGAFSYIGADVIIGDNCIIQANVTIEGKVKMGKSCFVKSGAIIGQHGFGFEKDANGVPQHFPHLGRVVVGDNVHIGANTCVDRATIGDTVIEDNCKISNLVNVAHNCHIGKNTIVTAGVIFSGGTVVGENSWIAPNVSTRQQIKIGNNALVGIGSVVIRDVQTGNVVYGNPAHHSK